MQHTINTIRAQLRAAMDHLDALERAFACVPQPVVRHADAVSLDVPVGYDTVLGYLAKYHPDILDVVDYTDPKVTLRDGYWCKHRTQEAGKLVRLVDAPPCLQAHGIVDVNAYPVEILARRWA